MKVPFLDLSAAIQEMRPRYDDAYHRVMGSGRLISGPEVTAFESAFAKFNNVPHCVGVGNGLDAIAMMLEAAGVCPGDEVIVPGHTCVASWLGVTTAGAIPVAADVISASFNIDPSLVEAVVTSKTRAVLAVHLYGQCADMTRLGQVCQKHGLVLLADAAQAAGAKWDSMECGALCAATAFSFYPTKNLGALGDAGAVVTADARIAERVRRLRNYGGVKKNEHAIRGRNSRLDELQAAFLSEKLRILPEWNARRRSLANIYLQRLSDLPGLALPEEPEKSKGCWHLFTVRLPPERRDRIREAMLAEAIETGIYYPVPPHLTPAFASSISPRPSLPVTEALATSILSLPLHPHLNEDAVVAVCESLARALGETP